MSIRTFFRHTLAAAAMALPFMAVSAPSARAAVIISVVAPPALPVYAQPICPAPGYIWTPGYWAYGDDGYYWVPGTWVLPPQPGLYWTPPYWAYEDGQYVYYPGYWGPEVGFYGGVNYGFGYTGVGFYGGEWRGGVFFYNTAFARVGVVGFTNVVYVHPVVVVNHSLVAFNGGPGGIVARPTAHELAYAHQAHIQPTPAQFSHQDFAAHDRTQFASVNHGRPGVPAAMTPAGFRSNPAGEPIRPAMGGAEARGSFAARPSTMNAGAPENGARPAYNAAGGYQRGANTQATQPSRQYDRSTAPANRSASRDSRNEKKH